MRIKKSEWCALITPLYKQNYFLSGWIANLGVVPLFFIAFLRAAPILFLVLALLVFVTRVLETILNLLWVKIENRLVVLSRMALIVKAILLFSLLGGHASQAYANLKVEKDLILARGEQKELTFPQGLTKFSIGNSEVLAKKHMGNTLLIKGKSMGFSDLKIWHKDKTQSHYRIYVLSKSDQLNNIQLAEALKDLSLELKVSGHLIIVAGTIESLDDYQLLKKMQNSHQDNLLFHIQLSKTLKGKIIGEIYEHLFRESMNSFRCQDNYLQIECRYSETQKISENVIKYLKGKFNIEFIPTKAPVKNYRVKLKLIQLERLDGKEISFGLNQLSAKMGDFFEQGLVSLINQNLILLRHSNTHASTLAEPESLTTLNQNVLMEVGSEIPFRADALNAINTQWKFAGLRIKLSLSPEAKFLKLKYQTEFTRPVEGSISGSKNEAEVNVMSNEPFELFKITFKTQTEDRVGIPVLEDIPLLGEIFKSKSDVSTYKTITGLAVVEEMP